MRRRLQQLDARVVPRAAQEVGKAAENLAVRRTAVVARVQRAALPDLRALDDRYASSGPLGFLREVPQLGFVLIALLFLIGTVTAVGRESARQRTAQQQVESVGDGTRAPAGEVLGPDVGDQVDDYLSSSSKTIGAAVSDSPETTHVALVSLTAYQTPETAQALLVGYQVQRVYLRAKAGGKEAAQLPVQITRDLLSEVKLAYQRTADNRLEAQKAYQTYVDTLDVATAEDQGFKDLYAAFARSTGIEAREYRSNCSCLYAAVVRASATELQKLADRPGVRAVELAPKGKELKSLQVLPLLPEVTGVVPQQQAAADRP